MAEFVDFIFEAQRDEGVATEFIERVKKGSPDSLMEFFFEPQPYRTLGGSQFTNISYAIGFGECANIIEAYKAAERKLCEDGNIVENTCDKIGIMAY
jgi:hypothetical protein